MKPGSVVSPASFVKRGCWLRDLKNLARRIPLSAERCEFQDFAAGIPLSAERCNFQDFATGIPFSAYRRDFKNFAGRIPLATYVCRGEKSSNAEAGKKEAHGGAGYEVHHIYCTSASLSSSVL